MRWDRLFDDLEAQLELAADEEFAAEVTDRTRREVARVRLVDRLRAALGCPLDLALMGGGQVQGLVRRVGVDWLLLESPSGAEVVVSNRAILAVRGLSSSAAEPSSWGTVESRLDLGHVLRAVARDRSTVTVVLRDGSAHVGTIDRVGADFVDLAEHAAGEARRDSEVRALRTITIGGMALVR